MNPVHKVQQETDGVLFTMGTGTLKVQVCSDSVIRVLYSPTATFPKRADFVVTKESWPAAQWTMQSTDDAVTLSTSLLKNYGHAQGRSHHLRRSEWRLAGAGIIPQPDS